MTLVSTIAVYFVIWWLVLFAVLPFGVRTQEEEGRVEPGTAPSAPARPRIVAKIVITSVLAGVLTAALYGAMEAGLMDFVLPPPR